MTLRVATLNANGIRAAGRRGFGAWLARRKPDVLCLQELRADSAQVAAELRCTRSYRGRWSCAEKAGYSGVGLLARGEPARWHEDEPFAPCRAEGRHLRADFEGWSAVSLYVPSGSSGPQRQALKERFLEDLLAHTAGLLAEGRPIALCGDFNVAHTALDIHDPKRNAKSSGFLPHERAWFDRLLAQGWRDVLREQHPGVPGLYSWWSSRGRAREKDLGWRLDYVLCSPALAPRVRRAWIEKQAGLSDHAPVWIELAEA